MRTDPREFHGNTFDFLVVGGGIQGAAVAREAALRGCRVCLVERGDFGGGTSSRSSKLIHGGLRYLRQGNFALVREALHEREHLLRSVPHLVRPQPLLMPFFRDGGGSFLLARIGVALYSWMAGRSTLPRPRSLSAKAALEAFPGLRARGLRRALLFWDGATQDQRLTLANLRGAVAAGAVAANHCELQGRREGALVLRDLVAEADVEVRARHVINAAGPRADGVRRALDQQGDDLVRVSRGSHLVLDPRPGETALGAFLPDGRIQFVVPHRDGTIVGTTDVDESWTEEEPTVPDSDVDYLLKSLEYLMDPPPPRADVRFAYCGWRSLPGGKGPPGALNREAFVVTEPIRDATLHTIVGGKLTTHRSLGERVVRKILDTHEPSPTLEVPLPGGGGPREVAEDLWWRHGNQSEDVRALCCPEPELAEPMCAHRPFMRAEAVWALVDQGAVRFSDLMLRRLVHLQGPCMRGECLRSAHELFVRHKLWPGDEDSASAIADLESEVERMTGGLHRQEVRV